MTVHVIICSNRSELVKAASRVFDGAGFRLTVCECGLQALAAAEVVDADLLILDLETSGLDCLLMLAAIKELAPALPIVAVSTRPQIDARAVSHKGVSYVTLPSGSTGAVEELLAGLTQTGRAKCVSDLTST
ncbi:MAG: response regulator [candidate division NC10 bacterium]|nr:response regulator [candidate division NC10 bacterium]MDE2321057.1 response regulator [candidate division NC10 bacterium]